MKILAVLMTLSLSFAAQAARVNYVPATADDIVDLAMEPVVANKTSYQMELSAVNLHTTNMCELSAEFKMQDPLTFVAEVYDSCRITVRFASDRYLRATISQEGSDFECGCGRGVTLDGRVKVKRN